MCSTRERYCSKSWSVFFGTGPEMISGVPTYKFVLNSDISTTSVVVAAKSSKGIEITVSKYIAVFEIGSLFVVQPQRKRPHTRSVHRMRSVFINYLLIYNNIIVILFQFLNIRLILLIQIH